MLLITKQILFILFCVSCVLFVFMPVRVTHTDTIKGGKIFGFNNIVLFVMVGLLVFAAVVKPPTMADYSSYVRLFQGVDQNERMEPAFGIIVKLLNIVDGNNYYLMFIVFALISIPLRVFLYNKFSPLIWGTIMVYLSNYYILHDLIQIRAAVASALLILLVYFSYKRKLGLFIITYLVSLSFHYSSIVFIVIWFISTTNNLRKYFLFLLFSYLLYFAQYSMSSLLSYIPISSISSLLSGYAGRESYENNVFNLIQIVRIALAFFFFYNLNSKQNVYPWYVCFLKVYIVGLCFLPLFSSLSGVALRMMELFVSCEPIVISVGFLISFKKKLFCKAAILAYAVLFFNIYYNATNYWDVDWFNF